MHSIGENKEIPEDAWTNNPMLQPTPHDPNWKGHEDGGINLDHYLYVVPKDYIKVKGKYVEAPPLPDDYYENHVSRTAYEKMLREMTKQKIGRTLRAVSEFEVIPNKFP